MSADNGLPPRSLPINPLKSGGLVESSVSGSEPPASIKKEIQGKSVIRKQPKGMSGRERAEYGAIVTFENSKGETLSIHRYGPVLKAVASACWIALGLDETARVVCISTPHSIIHDLEGRMGKQNDVAILGRIKLSHLAHERLRGRLTWNSTTKLESRYSRRNSSSPRFIFS